MCETYSDNLPLLDPVRKQLGASTDAFVTRFCDPWPAAWPGSLRFEHTLGAPGSPEPQTIEIVTGCTPEHDVEEIAADQPWLRLPKLARTAPFKLTVEVDLTDLAPGEHKAQIRVKVPAAFYPELTIPVTLTIVEPPPPVVE